MKYVLCLHQNIRLAVILLATILLILRESAAMAMTINSPAFKQNGHIPAKYTCEGDDVSPPLAWEGVPGGAKSLVLLPCLRSRARPWPREVCCRPKPSWVLSDRTRRDRHRYFHKLYALDITLDLKGATKTQIERAMRGHVLANAELIGTYQKGDR